MNRPLKVGLLWIAFVTAIVAAWLALQPEPTPRATTKAPTQTTTTTATATTTPSAARGQASAASASDASGAVRRRATRTATAVALQRRLELVAAADVAGADVDAGSLFDGPVPTGSLPRQAIKDGVAAVKPAIVDCYEQAVRQQPLAGTLKVLFEIGPDPEDEQRGVVVAGEVDSQMGSPFFEACVLQAVVGADFPRPEGDGIVRVTYPFRFASDEDAGPPIPPG